MILPADPFEPTPELLKWCSPMQIASGRANDEDFRPADLGQIFEGCAFMRSCRDGAATVSEPEWYAMLSIVARCGDGEAKAHELSKPYPGYSPAECSEKITQALEKSGPRTCRAIKESLGCGDCATCPFGKLTNWRSAPTVLGRPPSAARDFELADAADAAGDAPAPAPQAADAPAQLRGDLPAINTTDAQLRDMSDESLEAIRQWPIYQRTARLVRVQADEHGMHHVQTLEVPHLRGLLSRAANYYSLTAKGNRIGCVPPKTMVEDLLARGDWPFPPLDGVVETPCLRPDGTVLSAPGYDAATRLVYAPSRGLVIPSIPAHPSHDQVKAAAALLFEPFYDFPFESDADVAGVLALLLTVVMRPAIPGKVPLALIDAPKQGTGKSLLAEVVSIIGTGAAVPVSTLPTRPEEWRKWITAQLVAGRAMIQLDNLVGTLHSPELAAALTADTWSDRLLGSNDKTVTVPNRAVWVATGNNMKVAGDMPRRCYRIRVDARARDPQAREGWRHDPLVPWVRDHRSELLAAALTIARAWYAAGQPRAAAGSRLGSFEAWQSIVGGVLAFAGVPGFLGNLARFREEADDEGNALEAWMLALRERFADAWWKAADVVAAMANGEEKNATVRELAPAWLGAGGGELGKRVGKLLASVVGQVFGEWRLERRTGRGGILAFSFRPGIEGDHAPLFLKDTKDTKPTIPTHNPPSEAESGQASGGFGGFGGSICKTPRVRAHTHARAHAHGTDGEQTLQSHQTHPSPPEAQAPAGAATALAEVTLDLETRSLVVLKTAGAWAYARDPSTSFLCLVARVAGEAIGWMPYDLVDATGAAVAVPGLRLYVGEACPEPLAAALAAGATVVAHNAEFEAAMWEHVAVERMGWPAVARWRCTAAAATASGLPRSLDGAAKALGLAGKLAQGKGLIKRLSMPNGAGMFNEPTVAEMVALLEYNVQDVAQTVELEQRLGAELPAGEAAVWQAHLAVNRRGIAVDLQLVDAMQETADRLVAHAATRAVDATGGTVVLEDLTKRDKLLAWLAALGYQMPSLDADAVEKALAKAEALDHQVVVEVLRARQAVSRTSLSKLEALKASACDDGRLRGMLRYWGAGPGRWTGHGFQPHNLPRPNPDVDIDAAIDAVLRRDVEALVAAGKGDGMEALVACIRGCMRAGEGNVLVAMDFAAIEARGVLWLAEDEKHLEWFRQKRDVYCEFGTKVYGRPISKKDKIERQVSKNAVLGASYQMGGPRFGEYAAENGVDLKKAGVTDEQVISAYREEFTSLSDYEYGLWHRMGDGAMQCVRERVTVQVGKYIRFEMHGDTLRMILPSGRFLTYHQPRLEVDPRFGREGLVYTDWTYRTPQRERTFGGKLTENATQAVCRDLLAVALVRFASRTVLHVHDELVLEVPAAEGEAMLHELEAAMKTPPAWAAGFPIDAEGWVSARYRK